MFGQLTIGAFHDFGVPHFVPSDCGSWRTAIRRYPQGLWMHNLTKAGGPMLNQVINELAVMPLPLPGDDTDSGAQPVQANVSGGGVGVNGGAAAVQLRPATPEEQRYATELLARLLDMGFMRQIGLAKRRMAQLPDGEEKITLLGQITRMETARKDLQAQIYGNTVG